MGLGLLWLLTALLGLIADALPWCQSLETNDGVVRLCWLIPVSVFMLTC